MDADLRCRVRATARNANRLRWRQKARNVSRYPRYGSQADRLRYILTSPEIGDFSWRLTDVDRVAADLAAALGEPDAGRVAELLEEAYADETLRADYRAQRRAALLPREMKLGNRVVWWAVIRLRRPAFVVETGVWYGLGSLTILRALERNAQEHGVDGRLMSFEPDPTMGWLVPARLRPRWALVRATSEEALPTMLEGRAVDLFVHDTPSTFERESFELTTAHAHAAPGAVLGSGNGLTTEALPEFCRALGLPHRQIELPGDSWYQPTGVGITVTPAAAEPHRRTGRFARPVVDQGCSLEIDQPAAVSALE